MRTLTDDREQDAQDAVSGADDPTNTGTVTPADLILPEQPHPLHHHHPAHIITWSEWVMIWLDAKYFEQLDNLLYCGFGDKIRTSDFGLKVQFYLGVADGFCNHSRRFAEIAVPTEVEIDLRALACKAYSMVVQHYFTPSIEQMAIHSVRDARQFVNSVEFLDVVHFFRAQAPADYPLNLERNPASPKHQREAEITRQFGLRLCHLVFHSPDGVPTRDYWGDGETYLKVLAARQVLLPMMADLEELDWFFRDDYELDEDCLELLRTRAKTEQRYMGYLTDNSASATLAEAVYKGSPTARFLVVYEVLQRERRRQAEIAQLEREKADIERRRSKLFR